MVLAAVRMLAERDVYGLVLLDAKLAVRRRYGPLVGFVRDGVHIAESVLPLVGLDEQILALREREGAMLDIPAVAIMGERAPQSKLNLTLFWLEARRRYLLLVSRAQGHVDLEMQMSRLMRARLMAEAEATQRAKELARVNRDLDEFASIVSHDLKAPMRAIRYLVDDLERALADPAKDDPAAVLARIREQSLRMTTMLTQLHEYARAGYKHTVASKVDTRALAAGIVRSLPRPAGFRIEIAGEWPVMLTLASQLDLVIRNLVENAIKHHDRERGSVRITAKPARSFLGIEIADDGPGIAPHHHVAVFEPFRTLGESEGGGGMGLAFVKKTVEAAGGRIGLRSDPAIERGTTFSIDWPLSLT